MTSYACTESCGWIAAFISAIAFGSFAVPIKGEAANSVDIDPLVMQTYKTTMCFLTSWLVLLFGQEFTYTPWGIVSGIFWIPGGTMAIFSVRNAGLAVSQGTWSSMIVAVSFVWGIFGFHESVKNKFFACMAVVIMIFGLCGMSYYSAPSIIAYNEVGRTDMSRVLYTSLNNGMGECDMDDSISDDLSSEHFQKIKQRGKIIVDSSNSSCDKEVSSLDLDNVDSGEDHSQHYIHIFGKKMNRRMAGLISAFACGIWGGSIMVPMHFAPSNAGGMGYVISFGIGAAIVNLFLWIVRYLYNVYLAGSFKKGWEALPSFHFRVMWVPGAIAGSVWSIGNIASILSVHYLGEGVGYSLSQSAMLISGLWGIIWFREIRGTVIVAKWLLAAGLTVFSILLLSYEHKSSAVP